MIGLEPTFDEHLTCRRTWSPCSAETSIVRRSAGMTASTLWLSSTGIRYVTGRPSSGQHEMSTTIHVSAGRLAGLPSESVSLRHEPAVLGAAELQKRRRQSVLRPRSTSTYRTWSPCSAIGAMCGTMGRAGSNYGDAYAQLRQPRRLRLRRQTEQLVWCGSARRAKLKTKDLMMMPARRGAGAPGLTAGIWSRDHLGDKPEPDAGVLHGDRPDQLIYEEAVPADAKSRATSTTPTRCGLSRRGRGRR